MATTVTTWLARAHQHPATMCLVPRPWMCTGQAWRQAWAAWISSSRALTHSFSDSTTPGQKEDPGRRDGATGLSRAFFMAVKTVEQSSGPT